MKCMDFSRNHYFDIRVDYVFWYLIFFTKDIKLSITGDEPDMVDAATRDIVELRQLGVWP